MTWQRKGDREIKLVSKCVEGSISLHGCILVTKRIKSRKCVVLQFDRLLAEQCYIYCNFLECHSYKPQCFITFFVAILNERLNARRNKGGGGDTENNIY